MIITIRRIDAILLTHHNSQTEEFGLLILKSACYCTRRGKTKIIKVYREEPPKSGSKVRFLICHQQHEDFRNQCNVVSTQSIPRFTIVLISLIGYFIFGEQNKIGILH